MAMSQDQRTEAECLLEQGALYGKRVGLRRDGQPMIFAGFKQGVFSLYFGDEPIFHFDLDGRWQHAFLRGRHYLKRLDAAIQEIDRVREGSNLVLRRRFLDRDEAGRLDEEIRSAATTLLESLDGVVVTREQPSTGKARALADDELRDALSRIGTWSAPAWDDVRSRYHATYGPLPFTPPDCQKAIIVQATIGTPSARSFGGGPAHEHAVRSPAEFERHVQNVAELAGRRLLQTKGVFLAGADVLRRPGSDVLAYLDAIARALPLADEGEGDDRPRDVYVFLDDFQSPVVDGETLKAAARLRLSRIALGVESGDPGIRRAYGKTWTDQDLRDFAARAKEVGIGLSALVLVGAGGRERRKEHIARTADLITSLRLTRGDFVFLLDESEFAEPSFTLPSGARLDPAERAEQLDLLRQALSPLRARGVKTLPYSLAKQLT